MESYLTILRYVMEIDRFKALALYFGMTTGQLWIGREGGEKWGCLCDSSAWARKWAICCPSIRRNLWIHYLNRSLLHHGDTESRRKDLQVVFSVSTCLRGGFALS